MARSWKGSSYSNPNSMAVESRDLSAPTIKHVPFRVAPATSACGQRLQQHEQHGQMHWPLLCVANRWQAAFSGKLNIYSRRCLRPLEGFVDPPTPEAHMTLIAETGSSLVHRQMSELLWQNCRRRSLMMRWLHTKTPEHVRHSLTDTCTQVAWSAIPHTHMPFPAMQHTRQERLQLMCLGTGASDVGFRPKATMDHTYCIRMCEHTHTQFSLSNLTVPHCLNPRLK